MIDLSKEVNSILQQYAKGVDKAVIDVENEVADEAVKKLKSTSPKKKKGKKAGAYAKGWRIDKKQKDKYARTVIHNKEYQLTHLLEHGHDIVRNGKVVGHAEAKPHIKDVEEWTKKEVEERIRSRL